MTFPLLSVPVILLYLLHLRQCGAQTSLSTDFYKDFSCSNWLKVASVPLNTCFLTVSAGSLDIDVCDNGNATVRAFNDPQCTEVVLNFSYIEEIHVGKGLVFCWGKANFLALEVTCPGSDEIHSTVGSETVAASSTVVPSAGSTSEAGSSSSTSAVQSTNSPTPSIPLTTSTSELDSTSSNNSPIELPTSSYQLSSSSSFRSNTPISTYSQSPSSSASPSSQTSANTTGISQSDQIALGVGLGIGIPTVILNAWQLYVMWKSRSRLAEKNIPEMT